ncbi:MAG: hypothetical protein K5682_07635 [Lachnospiraceae bacterium]|nr:hypothetical protein [Lachnospiraceae bacterium]
MAKKIAKIIAFILIIIGIAVLAYYAVQYFKARRGDEDVDWFPVEKIENKVDQIRKQLDVLLDQVKKGDSFTC